MEEHDEAELILELLKGIKKSFEASATHNPIREKSVGHPDYPSVMPDLTGLA